MNLQWSNFQPIAKKVLSHTDFGLVVLAENADKIAVGFMMFTYEWCDWRNGLFFWVQGVEGDDQALKEMKAFLAQFCKTDLKYKWCGVRL